MNIIKCQGESFSSFNWQLSGHSAEEAKRERPIGSRSNLHNLSFNENVITKVEFPRFSGGNQIITINKIISGA